MLISTKKRFIFISNSKSASSSIEQLLLEHCKYGRNLPPELKHMHWVEMRRKYRDIFDDEQYPVESFFRFGVIRDPLSWVLSWYNYRLMEREDGQRSLPLGTSFEEFWRMDDWVKYSKRRKASMSNNKNLQQWKFLDQDKVCRFDAIIPYDELDVYMPRVLRRLGVVGELPKVNVSVRTANANQISTELADEVRSFYIQDELFLNEWRIQCAAALPLN